MAQCTLRTLRQAANDALDALLPAFEKAGAARGAPLLLAIVDEKSGIVTWQCVGDEPFDDQIGRAKADALQHKNGVNYCIGLAGSLLASADDFRALVASAIEERLQSVAH